MIHKTMDTIGKTPQPTHDAITSENDAQHEDDVQPVKSDTTCNLQEQMSNQQDELPRPQDQDTNSGVNEEVPTVFSSTDILRIKNKFLEKVEELRILRVSGIDNEQRINGLLAENHELERKMDDVVSAKANEQEQHERDIAEVKKQMEQKMHKLEADKNQTNLKTDMWEKEVKALKEEIRTLLVTKYSLEKTIKDQEHRLQMQSSAGDSHMSQMNALEGRCKDLAEDYKHFREQLTRLDNEVKCATDINSKLSRVNTHQQCIITSLTEEKQSKQDEIIAIKANTGQQEGGTVLMHKNAVIQHLKADLHNKIQVNKKLEEQITQIKEGQQRTLSSLSESHLLADRHLNSSLKSAEEVSTLTSDLKETKETLEKTKGQLTACQRELDKVKEEKESMETQMKAKVEETEVKIEQLKKEFDSVNQAYHNLEELNSSWAKKNKDLSSTVQQLTQESEETSKQINDYKTQIEEITKQMDDYKHQIEKLTQRPDTCDATTATEIMEDAKLDMKDTSTQTSHSENAYAANATQTSHADDVTNALKSTGNICIEDVKKKIEDNMCASSCNLEPHTDSTGKNPEVSPGVITVGTDENGKPCEQEKQIAEVEELETSSQTVLVPPVLDRCLNKMPINQVSDFKLRDMETKLRDEKKNRDLNQTVNKVSTEDHARQSTADTTQMAIHSSILSTLHTPGNTSVDTALNAINKVVPQSSLPQDVSRKTHMSFNEGYISSTAFKKSDQAIPATSMKSSPSIVTNQAGQMFITNKIIQAPSGHELDQNYKAAASAQPTTYENSALTRFKGLSHLTSPPLLSSPVIKRNDQSSGLMPPGSRPLMSPDGPPLRSPGGRYSFQLSSMTSARSPKMLSNPNPYNVNIKSTSKGTGNLLKIPTKSPLEKSNSAHTDDIVSKSSNQESVPESPKQAPKDSFSYSSLNLAFPTPSERATTPRSSGRWFTKTGSNHESVHKPGSNNNSQEWPDFEGEFSGESQLPADSTAADNSLPRLVMKRRIQEEALFSDEDEGDNSDPKAGVLSQIERIQTFLKTDRLKRAKKQNKEPVV